MDRNRSFGLTFFRLDRGAAEQYNIGTPRKGKRATYNTINTMKTKYCVMALVAGSMMLASCDTMNKFNYVNNNQVGVATQTFGATVVAARDVTIDASSTSRNLGTGLGAALGAGAGSLLGGGKGQLVSTVGFGVLGAAAGRGLGDMNTTSGQQLTVKLDNSKTTYTVTQPIMDQIGRIGVGQHGVFQMGGNSSCFIPDGAPGTY